MFHIKLKSSFLINLTQVNELKLQKITQFVKKITQITQINELKFHKKIHSDSSKNVKVIQLEFHNILDFEN